MASKGQLAVRAVVSSLRFQGAFTDPSLECAHCHGKDVKGNSNMGLRARIDRLAVRRKEEMMMREDSIDNKRKSKRLRGTRDVVTKEQKAANDFYKGGDPAVVEPDAGISGAVRRLQQRKRGRRGKRVSLPDGAAELDGKPLAAAEGLATDPAAGPDANRADLPNSKSRPRGRGGNGGKKGKKGGRSFQPLELDPEESALDEDPVENARTAEPPNSKSRPRGRGGKGGRRGKKGERALQPPELDPEESALDEDPVENARIAEPPNSKSRPRGRGGKGGRKGKKGGRVLQPPELDPEESALDEDPVVNEVRPAEPPYSKSKPRPRGGKGGKKGKKGAGHFSLPS